MKRLLQYLKGDRGKEDDPISQGIIKEFLYISAFPKSGSTFILLVALDLLKYSRVHLIYDFLREQDLYEPKLIANVNKKTISKHHTLATNPNVLLFQKYKISPVVLTRNLPDTVISLRDHISVSLQWPHFVVPNDFNKWEEIDQFEFLIDLALPWYIFFYASWWKVKREKNLLTKFVRYEDFHSQQAATIQEILEFWGYKFSLEVIEDSMERVNQMAASKNRRNKGIMNRGKEILSESQMKRINSLTRHYPDIDFNPIL